MRIYNTQVTKVLSTVYCDVCGSSCTKDTGSLNPATEHEYATLKADWGYFSQQDGIKYKIEICEQCFHHILNFIREKRKNILGPFNYPYDNDPLQGTDKLP